MVKLKKTGSVWNVNYKWSTWHRGWLLLVLAGESLINSNEHGTSSQYNGYS